MDIFLKPSFMNDIAWQIKLLSIEQETLSPQSAIGRIYHNNIQYFLDDSSRPERSRKLFPRFFNVKRYSAGGYEIQNVRRFHGAPKYDSREI